MYSIELYHRFADLPDCFNGILDAASQQGMFTDPEFISLLVSQDLEEGDEFHLYAITDNDNPVLLIPMSLTREDATAPKARTLCSISHAENYTSLTMLFADDSNLDKVAVLKYFFDYLKTTQPESGYPAMDVIRLCPYEKDSELGLLLESSLKEAGFWIQTYINSHNQYEYTQNLTYEHYLAGRSANVRYNIRRRKRNLDKNYGAVEFDLYTDDTDLPQGVADYIKVTEASWKPLLTMITDKILDHIQFAADKRCIRLGILKLDGRPVAAQLWVIFNKIAYCLRLAYDESFKNDAVGVVLTSDMIEHLLDQDRVSGLDYGYGEEEYKSKWMKTPRIYWGIIAFNPGTLRGKYFGLKHILGRPVKRLLKWIRDRVLPRPENEINSTRRDAQ